MDSMHRREHDPTWAVDRTRNGVATMLQTLPETEGPRSKRAAILSAAVESSARSATNTPSGRCRRRVGIGQTALYHYFESKAHCLLTIMHLD